MAGAQERATKRAKKLIAAENKPRKKRKLSRRHKGSSWEPAPLKEAPHSFVIKRGTIPHDLNLLMQDLRCVLEPFTAKNLQVKKRNSVRDFVSVASLFNVKNMHIITKTEKSAYLRFIRLPRGPTLTYKILDFTLRKDVVASQKKPVSSPDLYLKAPLVILKSFNEKVEGDEVHAFDQNELQSTMWQGLFQSIDVRHIKLRKMKRCVLLRLNTDTGNIDFRHYAIRVRPVGVTKQIRRLVTRKKIPDLGKLASIDDMLDDGGMSSGASDGEEDQLDTARHVDTTSEEFSTAKSAIRLVELGPRMTIKLHRIHDGLLGGTRLYG
uniref:Protein Peter pan n=1 Tax=Aceria tosichella TaxID=561515 RepID=A0A6G1SFD4_9ACAR